MRPIEQAATPDLPLDWADAVRRAAAPGLLSHNDHGADAEVGLLVARPLPQHSRLQHRNVSAHHLRQAYVDAKPRLRALRTFERDKKQARQRALLELKSSTDTAFGKLWATNERRERAERQLANARQAEARIVRNRGGNPYLHARQQQEAERRERDEAQRLSRRRQNEARICAKLLREERHTTRQARTARVTRHPAQRPRGLLPPSTS